MAPPPLLLRGLSLLRLRLHQPLAGGAAPAPRRFWSTLTETSFFTEAYEKDQESEILRDIKPITELVIYILHSKSYLNGEKLKAENEKAVTEQLLVYHPHYEDKIGSGLSCIIVDRHPVYRASRCLFVVRTDGGCIDFSYRKCLQSYVRAKYPSYTESVINKLSIRLVRAINLYHPRLVPAYTGLARKE